MKMPRPFKIIAIYALLGSLWILISDRLVHYLWSNDLPPAYLQTVKGLLFILVTSLLFYLLLRKYYRKIFAAEQGLQDQASRYQAAFDNSPGPLWEEDFSRVKAALDDLKRSGVDDLEAYLDAHPEFVAECVKKVRIVDVNQAAVDLHGAQNKSELLQSLSAIFSEATYPVLKAQILEVARGKTSLETLAAIQTLDGRPIESIVRWSVLPGHEDNLDRVYVSVSDVTEQQRLTNELEESEQKYRTLIENSSEAVLVAQDETIRFANPAAVTLTGLPLDRLQGSPLNSLIHPEDREIVLGRHRRRLAGENPPSRYQFRMICALGETRWVEIGVARLTWQGRPSTMLIVSDITKMKSEQEELQRAKNLLEKTYNNLEEAVLLIDPTRREIIDCNPAVEKIFGYIPQELIGQDTRILHIDDAHFQKFAEVGEQILDQKKTFHIKYRMRRKDGGELITENTVTVIDELLGWRQGVISVIRDITENEKFAQALKDSEEKYRSLTEHANESIIVVQDDRIVFANPQWVKISGYSLNDSPGHLFSKLVHPDDRAHIESMIERLLAGQNIPKDVEFRFICLQGSVLWVRANAVFLEWNGQPAAMALMTDITQQKRLQEKNREMEVRMSQAQKMESIGVLAGGIAHDFNNLLSVILGFSRLTLEQLSEDDPGRENLEKVLAAGERASGLVNQILTFSRRKAEVKQPLQFNLALKETLKMLRSSVPAHIDIQQHIQTSSFVEMDITRLHQVIMNLCTNAYQSLPDSGGRIDITLSDHRLGPSEAKQFPELSPGDYICLQVSDNGPGMSSEVVQRIFDPYFTTKEVGRGTGLGLSVVHGIVQQAGGAIDVDSKPGQGTTFTVYLPIWQGERQTSEPRLNERQETNGNEHLLVVDDEPSVLKLLQVNLQTLGYRVSGLSKAREALETLRQNPSDFDALITDQAMPGITGRDLAQEVQAIRPDLPVILCTGKEEAWQDQGYLEGVIRAVLLKPFDKKELAQTVRRVLDEDQQAMDQKSGHGASTGPAHSKGVANHDT